MEEKEQFIRKVIEIINKKDGRNCIDYDPKEKAIRVIDPQKLKECFKWDIKCQNIKTFWKRMKRYGFKKRRIRGIDYFINEEFDPNDSKYIDNNREIKYLKENNKEQTKEDETIRKDNEYQNKQIFDERKKNISSNIIIKPTTESNKNEQQFKQEIYNEIVNKIKQIYSKEQNEIKKKKGNEIIIYEKEYLNLLINQINERMNIIDKKILYIMNCMATSEIEMLNICHLVDEITQNHKFR
ncbi:hypothetical protein EDI_265900 [Entamoeba dispar SAW760]|uniref:HSF-type DNA-binding domain-containing protein n=1 Tax=Entamoeba dispar (strain ATCC PRA-260 / SAW760) TaxID=370354 RepID=B0EBV0_ENTDS|nr:uncharacterized protein EDI_265900 [Entamoeba dispar SAW760]EDR27995.1 hypothetical protein EDI_265900 [Entamoeba dispar SAW760]|eukprot:EDR27995.1 hypothetical protein EDI_265900 [Entamoeba dispar SAW760]